MKVIYSTRSFREQSVLTAILLPTKFFNPQNVGDIVAEKRWQISDDVLHQRNLTLHSDVLINSYFKYAAENP